MAGEWLILADDLTGAADGAVAFAKRGIASTVGWGDSSFVKSQGSPVYAFNGASRHLTADDAASRHRNVLGRLLGRNRTLFKKIDSTLRGQPAAEIAATVEFVHAQFRAPLGILAPAFPGTNRTTEGGHVYMDGIPLEKSALWQLDHTYPTADLVDILATAGIDAERIPLDVIRDEDAAFIRALDATAADGKFIAVCDALVEDDLDRIAAACLSTDRALFFIGSAGLAHAVAAHSVKPDTQFESIALAPTRQGIMIVVGSLASASRLAAQDLAARDDWIYLPIEPTLLLDASARADRAAIRREVIGRLDANKDVLVAIVSDGKPSLSIEPRLVDQLARILKPALYHAGGLVAAGGETAAALLGHLGVSGIRIVGEIETGIPLGLTVGDIALPVVTKAGAFGDRGCLTRIVEILRAIQRRGFVS
jgi:uncharacterized protein YgbK (DUF1537 family)